jgi:tight adherence protein C
MTFAILILVVTFVFVGSCGLLLFDRQTTTDQISSVIVSPAEDMSLQNRVRKAIVSLGSVIAKFDFFAPKSKTDISLVQKRLIRAGFRKDSAIKIFYGAKVVAMTTLSAISLVSGLANLNYFFVILIAFGMGFMAPDFWLRMRISSRKRLIRRGLPDVLDLLIVCVEAGLSLDQAVVRTSEELNRSNSAIGEELSMVVLEQRAGCPRIDAWKHLADRTNEGSVRSVVSTLIQSEQFGTSIAKTLRVHSETLRTKRVQQIEEQAAKTGIKILFPLVLLIFPSVFVVTLGPAVILMMESFSKTASH